MTGALPGRRCSVSPIGRNLLSAVAMAMLACAPRSVVPGSSVVAYVNGQWFDGSGFKSGTLYVENERFIARPSRVDRTVDLRGGYVVPPFGEAHNHNVEASANVAQQLGRYVQTGVFYVGNPNNLPHTRTALANQINRPGTPDVAFANGGLTGPGGHPMEMAQANIARHRWTAEDGEGGFFFSVSNASELRRAWPKLLASRPDFVKVYLVYSEQYAARLADPRTFGWRGLDPSLLPETVRLAHAEHLRVAVHVESAFDFHVAVDAGADQVAHMPGFRGDETTSLPDPSRYQIREEDALRAGRQNIVVVTTLAGLAKVADDRGDFALRQVADQLNRRNLAVLRRNRVEIAIGSDEYDDTSVGEAVYLARSRLMEPAELLRSWTENTPRAIFPDRQIGRIAPGYEASFLVLEGDPLSDFNQIKRIRLGVKQGRPMATSTSPHVEVGTQANQALQPR